ncbi:hypothetical protein RBH29_08865 [Herbivorax sp. ANBcel31]|uniref:hypothetical protein n=1 Tax=Herbivorax sp. ANBcel31 TaxID=3069754 RepID=UPI0027B21F92|nr:hypothetical protein [Herbivorax sp. ANBcel31]MDQ2086534.1 hypothetical protein [Herbivorax sp. ANBcel31]
MDYSEFWVDSKKGKTGCKKCCKKPHVPKKDFCPQLPGTVLRISIPPGAVINLLNIVEVTSPGGICLIIRLPFLGKKSKLGGIFDSIRDAGGEIEVLS